MLTRKQNELLGIIEHYAQTNKVTPSYEEMAKLAGINSKSGVHRLIMGLEERGYIRRLPNKARALELLRSPEGKVGFMRLLLSHRRLLAALRAVVGTPNDAAVPLITNAALVEAWDAIQSAPQETK